MNKPIYFLVGFVLFVVQTLHAQDSIVNTNKKLRFAGIESGIDVLFCQAPEFDFIRGDVLPYASGSVSETLRGNLFKKYIGLKMEFRNKANHLGLLFGLRFARFDASLGKEDLFNSSTAYFYLLDNQTGTTTEYFRINEINRKTDYLGVPIEFRWISKGTNDWRFFMKFGLELDFKINSSSEVVFHNEQMSEYEAIVMDKFKNAGSFFSSLYLSYGINFDRTPNIDAELILPYVVLTPEMSGMLKTNAGMGFKVEIRLPY